MFERLEDGPSEVSLSQPQPADGTLDQVAGARYLSVLDGLVADATQTRQMHALADGLAWTVARIAFRCGPGATGDLIQRIGDYMTGLESRRLAAEEAEQARQDGRQPN